MRAFSKLAVIQTKLYLREPIAVFFTLGFGPLLLVLMGFIFGNEPQALFTGRGQMDVMVPGFIALIIGITGLTSVPIPTSQRREAGVLRRFSATPLKPLIYFISDLLAPFVVTLVGALLLIVMGFAFYHVKFSGNWLSVLGAVSLSAAAFFAVGYAIACVMPNSRSAIIFGNVIVIPLTIFSGSMVPLEVMSAGVRSASNFDPLKHAVGLIRGVWFGDVWSAHLTEIAVLVGMLVLGMVVVALTFKWE